MWLQTNIEQDLPRQTCSIVINQVAMNGLRIAWFKEGENQYKAFKGHQGMIIEA